ncbi:hypothetical protein HYU40_01160 [Candidatus Woesearchaeota archaeon]|nr:hypothetical protein [Candidatus Woesearchaeota archaeon]
MKHSWQVSAVLLCIFLAAQVIGLFVVNSYFDAAASEKATTEAGKPVVIYQDLPYGVERPDISPNISYLLIAAAIIIGTVLLLLIIKFRKLSLWKLWYSLALIITLTFSFASFLPKAIAAVISIAVSIFRVFRPNALVHNLSELFIYGGLAAMFVPILNVRSAAILLVLIAVYDFFAVFHMKHMVTLAKFQASNRIFAGLFVPKQLSLKSAVSPIASDVAPTMKNSLMQKQQVNHSDSGDYAIVGGGDIGFPLLFAGTLLPAFGFYKTLIIPAFAAAALLLLLLISKKGKFYPAMPFIAAGCFVGYGVLQLFRNL